MFCCDKDEQKVFDRFWTASPGQMHRENLEEGGKREQMRLKKEPFDFLGGTLITSRKLCLRHFETYFVKILELELSSLIYRRLWFGSLRGDSALMILVLLNIKVEELNSLWSELKAHTFEQPAGSIDVYNREKKPKQDQ